MSSVTTIYGHARPMHFCNRLLGWTHGIKLRLRANLNSYLLPIPCQYRLLMMFSALWCEATLRKQSRQRKESVVLRVYSPFFLILADELEKPHILNKPLQWWKNFAIQKVISFCFCEELPESVQGFVQNLVSTCSWTQRNCRKTPKSCAIKQMVNTTLYTIEFAKHSRN